MENLINIGVRSIFIDNMIFAYFLGHVFISGDFQESEYSIWPWNSGCICIGYYGSY